MNENQSKIVGIVHRVGPIQEIGQNGFIKQEVDIETGDGQYTSPVQVEFTRNKTELASGMQVGHAVEILAQVKGRRWQNPNTGVERIFMSLEVLELAYLNEMPAHQRQNPPAPPAQDSQQQTQQQAPQQQTQVSNGQGGQQQIPHGNYPQQGQPQPFSNQTHQPSPPATQPPEGDDDEVPF